MTEEPKQTTATPIKDEVIVLAEKRINKMFLHMIAEGGGTIAFPDTSMFAIRILIADQSFNAIQLITKGKDGALKSNAFKREKIIRKNIPKTKENKQLNEVISGEEVI